MGIVVSRLERKRCIMNVPKVLQVFVNKTRDIPNAFFLFRLSQFPSVKWRLFDIIVGRMTRMLRYRIILPLKLFGLP